LTGGSRVVVVKMMSTVGGNVVVRTGVSDVIVGRELGEELTVTRVTVMGGSMDKILVLIFSGN
jgi:hypothetical protein